jgi:hypothetical protein
MTTDEELRFLDALIELARLDATQGGTPYINTRGAYALGWLQKRRELLALEKSRWPPKTHGCLKRGI